ncbi:isochorismatase family protein [Musicola paradisiaca]|uniref:isochorismatase n=1 Tax=Musicola paradisiaca (strain Ech703) TaxID=579405 RepID=C6CCK3_MUSP7|nr:isochorismatase family protein [Musicola paradisiaca]ACS86846.1 Isochorismatase [Musicola paradisiaca Ech703]
MTIPKLSSYSLPTVDELPFNKAHWVFEPQRAALLIHDMQDYFLNFWGEESPLVTTLVANIVSLRRYCSSLGIPVFYTAQPSEQSDAERALLSDMWGSGLKNHPLQQQITSALTPADRNQVLMKRRYSAFHHSPLESILKECARDQLIICGVYAHIGCLTTATDAFMRDIKAFMVADALADFTREDHLMALNYTAECSGCVVMMQDLMLTPQSKMSLRETVLALLNDSEQPEDDDNLIDYGLDSVQIMALTARWSQIYADIDFIKLAQNPTINGWWSMLAREDQ